MSQAMDAQLPLGKRISLKFHLMICDGCSNFMSQISYLRKAAKRVGNCEHCESLHLSDEAKKRIHEAIKPYDKQP